MIIGLMAAGLLGLLSPADPLAKELRALEAPPPVAMTPLPAGGKASPMQLVKVVIQPRLDRPWALVYSVFELRGEDAPASPPDELVSWRSDRAVVQTDAFARIFDEELRAAGFQAGGEDSLFGDRNAADLQVGVRIDDLQGRFCSNCANLLLGHPVTAVVVMNARWEVYSTLRGAVLAKVVTHGGVNSHAKLGNGPQAVILDAFRENVRQLLASEEFRRVATESPGAAPAPAPLGPILYHPGPSTRRAMPAVAQSVVAILAGDAFGSGFLIGSEGYLLTNRHVVGDARYVKVRFADRSEAVGEVLRSDRRRDVALVKVDAGARVPLGLRAAPAQPGETDYAIGTPLEQAFQGTVTRGVVSAVRVDDGLPVIQSDVAVDHGNSGGPLLDENGQVIGLARAGYVPDGVSHNINFFIPIGEALKALGLQAAP